MRNLLQSFLIYSLLAYLVPYPMASAQGIVVDAQLVAKKGIITINAWASTIIKQAIESPAWQRISEVQTFLKESSTIIRNVIKNLKMTKELIAIEEDIFNTLTRYYQLLNEAENFPSKFIHHKTLVELWYETGRIFEVFDFATKERRGILNDEGRIILIKEALIRAKRIQYSMRSVLRAANKDLAYYHNTKQETQTFIDLFR